MTFDDLGNRLFAYVPEVAQILGRDERTVRAAIRAGQIPATKAGRGYIVRVSWLREQAGQPAPVPAAMPDLDELADRVADRLFARLGQLFGAKVGGGSEEAADRPNTAAS
jgi:excisionase family DNA binding protein